MFLRSDYLTKLRGKELLHSLVSLTAIVIVLLQRLPGGEVASEICVDSPS